MLLDEPTLGLAPIVIDELFEKILEINKTKGITIIMVEQNAYAALDIAHRAYILATGEIVLEGKGSELLQMENIVESYLGTKTE
jgi:branched-chain amino acid transport system ATP-binding protein